MGRTTCTGCQRVLQGAIRSADAQALGAWACQVRNLQKKCLYDFGRADGPQKFAAKVLAGMQDCIMGDDEAYARSLALEPRQSSAMRPLSTGSKSATTSPATRPKQQRPRSAGTRSAVHSSRSADSIPAVASPPSTTLGDNEWRRKS